MLNAFFSFVGWSHQMFPPRVVPQQRIHCGVESPFELLWSPLPAYSVGKHLVPPLTAVPNPKNDLHSNHLEPAFDTSVPIPHVVPTKVGLLFVDENTAENRLRSKFGIENDYHDHSPHGTHHVHALECHSGGNVVVRPKTCHPVLPHEFVQRLDGCEQSLRKGSQPYRDDVERPT